MNFSATRRSSVSLKLSKLRLVKKDEKQSIYVVISSQLRQNHDYIEILFASFMIFHVCHEKLLVLPISLCREFCSAVKVNATGTQAL